MSSKKTNYKTKDRTDRSVHQVTSEQFQVYCDRLTLSLHKYHAAMGNTVSLAQYSYEHSMMYPRNRTKNGSDLR